jgi:Ca-activated chloride channel family protein
MIAAPGLLVFLAQQEVGGPSFPARVETVYVNAFVTSHGHPLPGLSPEDFEVEEDGVPQRVAFARPEEVPLDAVLAFDTSSSVAGPKLQDLVTAAHAFLDGLAPDDRVSLLTFSHELRLWGPPEAARATLAQALSGLEGHGATGLYDAADAALTLAGQARGRALILLFTDGVDTISWLRPADVLKSAGRSDGVVYAVGIEDASQDQFSFLQELVGLTGGRLLWASSSRDLTGTFLRTLADVRNRYLLGYEPLGPRHPGWHRLAVRLRNRRGDVRARRGYFLGPE